MATMTFTVQLEERDYAVLTWHAAASTRRLSIFGIVGLLALPLVFGGVASYARFAADPIFVGLVVVSASAFVWAAVASPRRLARSLHQEYERFGPATLAVDEQGITRTAANSEVRYAWRDIRYAIEKPDHWLLFVTLYETMILPKRAVGDPARLAALIRDAGVPQGKPPATRR